MIYTSKPGASFVHTPLFRYLPNITGSQSYILYMILSVVNRALIGRVYLASNEEVIHSMIKE